MFNLFSEIKKDFKLPFLEDYTMVNLSGKALYVEGHKGIIELSKEIISFRIKKGVVVVEGSGLSLKILAENTLCIEGKIKKTEVY